MNAITIPYPKDQYALSDKQERVLLGSVLRRPKGLAEVIHLVEPEHFREYHHQVIWTAFVELFQDGKGITPHTVTEQIFSKGKQVEFDGTGPLGAFLLDLQDLEPTGLDIENDARKVVHKAGLRRLRRVLLTGVQSIDSPTMPPAKIAEEIESNVLEAGQELFGVKDDDLKPAAEVVAEMFDALDEAEIHPDKPRGILTGIVHLDELLGGLRPGELSIVAARPGVGKTAVLGSLAAHAGTQQGKKVLFVSLEQKSGELAERIVCALAGVNSQAIRQSLLSDGEKKRIHAAGETLRNSGLTFSDCATQTLVGIAGRARRVAQRTGLDLIVIDYLQLVTPGNPREPRHEQVAQISRGLKKLAGTLSIPILVAAQLNREVENRSNQTPRLSDLRESGSIEQDADSVILLHRDKEDSADVLQMILAKNRHGPTGEATVVFDRRTGLVTDSLKLSAFE